MNLYVMCGLPGSGKSLWAQNYIKYNSNTIIICKDKIREMISGRYVFSYETEGFVKEIVEAIYQIESFLSGSVNVIIDETHITYKKRKRVLDYFKYSTKKVCVYCSAQKGNLKRRMNDSRGYSTKEWNRVIENMKDSFEIPTLNEGFDEIIEVKI